MIIEYHLRREFLRINNRESIILLRIDICPVYGNMLNRNFATIKNDELLDPDQFWVADVQHLKHAESGIAFEKIYQWKFILPRESQFLSAENW